MTASPLDPLREKLDEIDRQIVDLLSQRFETAREVGTLKKKHGMNVTDSSREQALITKLEELTSDSLLREHIQTIYATIIAACKSPQELFMYDTMPFKSVGVIGMGVMGGSIARALQVRNPAASLYTLEREGSRATVAKPCSLPVLVESCDLIVIASPIDTVIPMAQDIARQATGRKHKLTVIDIASVKGSIAQEFMTLTNDSVEFLATHPMAGSEKSGYKASKATLFLHNPWIITPHSKNTESTIAAVKNMIMYIGGLPTLSDPEEHDRNVAVVSHLVFLVSVYMFAYIATDYEEIMSLAGSGFETTTRLASGSIEMHDQIFKHNSANILKALSSFLQFVNSHRIDTSGSYDFFAAYKTSRDEYISKKYSK